MLNYLKYVNLMGSTKSIPDIISEFGKIVGHKVNIQKSKAFLYTSNEPTERETKGKKPLL